jgi:hypothetical protein
MPKVNRISFQDWLICEFQCQTPSGSTRVNADTVASTVSVSTMNEKNMNRKKKASNLLWKQGRRSAMQSVKVGRLSRDSWEATLLLEPFGTQEEEQTEQVHRSINYSILSNMDARGVVRRTTPNQTVL